MRDITHVYPIQDLRDHILEGAMCWCKPTVDEDVIVHNSMDDREDFECGNRKVS